MPWKRRALPVLSSGKALWDSEMLAAVPIHRLVTHFRVT